MASRTFTVLVTVTGDALPDAVILEQFITRQLEQGTADAKPVSAAFVDVLDGDYLGVVRMGREHEEANRTIFKAHRAHAEIAASWAKD